MEAIIPSTVAVELHAHTTASDGVLTPAELVEVAVERKLSALAITDHDIVAGVEPARRAARRHGLEIIAGVEFSSNLDGHEIHVLGLFIDDRDEALLEAARQARRYRRQRARKIVERLERLDLCIDFAAVEASAPAGSIGRPHIAQVLVQDGMATNLDDAFRRYIGVGRPAFSAKRTLDAAVVIKVVHGAGGVAILAHPASSRINDEEIRELAALGLDGVEVAHPKHNRRAQTKLEAIAEELGLLTSAGSDFHGPGSGRSRLGDKAVAPERLEELRQAAARHRKEALSSKDRQ